MIASLRGAVVEAGPSSAVVEAGGVGYEVLMAPGALRRLPPPGEVVELRIAETTGLYGGATTLYGFLTREEKDIFLTLKENVPATGGKKALELLDKASRSLPEFRRAVLDGDARALTGVFGFTRKTAEKLVAALKGVLSGPAAARAGAPAQPDAAGAAELRRALDALLSMGYKAAESRAALQAAAGELGADGFTVERLVRSALRQI